MTRAEFPNGYSSIAENCLTYLNFGIDGEGGDGKNQGLYIYVAVMVSDSGHLDVWVDGHRIMGGNF